MKLAAAVIIAGTLLSIGFCMETSRKETAKQLQELIRFLLFAGQEIEIRGSILEDVFTKASSITQGATKELVSRMAKRMAEGGDFLQEWSNAVNEVYRKMGWNEQEEELILHCASDFLLFERKMVKEHLFFDANQLSQLYEKRITSLEMSVSYASCLAFARQLFFLFCYGKRGIPEWMSI